MVRVYLAFTAITAITAMQLQGSVTEQNEAVVESTEDSQPTLLFVQNASSFTYNDGVLSLHGADKIIIYFSDRPDRIAGTIGQEEMSDLVTESFATSAPNAALSVLTEYGVETIILTLTKGPVIEGDTLILPGIELLLGEPPPSGGSCSLFIDTIRRPPPPPGPRRPPPPPPPRL
ncbi:MAG: hypothetical protein AAGH40_10065 [Verrucomicrobiota bacterium]